MMRDQYEKQLLELNKSMMEMGGLCEDAITIAVIGTVIALPFLVMLAMPQLFAFSLASIIAGILITFVTKDINLDFLTPLALPFFVYGLFSCKRRYFY